jgi:hypothetical protein
LQDDAERLELHSHPTPEHGNDESLHNARHGTFLAGVGRAVSRQQIANQRTTPMTVFRSCGGLPSGESTLQIIRLTAFKIRGPFSFWASIYEL